MLILKATFLIVFMRKIKLLAEASSGFTYCISFGKRKALGHEKFQ